MATVKEAKGILGKDMSGKGIHKAAGNTGIDTDYLIYVVVKLFWNNITKPTAQTRFSKSDRPEDVRLNRDITGV